MKWRKREGDEVEGGDEESALKGILGIKLERWKMERERKMGDGENRGSKRGGWREQGRGMEREQRGSER